MEFDCTDIDEFEVTYPTTATPIRTNNITCCIKWAENITLYRNNALQFLLNTIGREYTYTTTSHRVNTINLTCCISWTCYITVHTLP